MEFNKYQTPIEKLVYRRAVDKKIVETPFSESPKEVQDEFYEYLNSVPMIQWLISKDRPLVGDLPKDSLGRAIWDIERPPIITNTDYFRPGALNYQRTGQIVNFRPSRSPNSEYMRWFEQEKDRFKNGYLRPDGAWISGYMYWYLNYCPIIVTKAINEDGTVGEREVDFPSFWEGIWWRSMGWEQARTLGLNFAEISKRGSSKSYFLASALSKIFVVGDGSYSSQKKMSKRGILMAYQRDFLNRDGTLNKFEDMIDFQAQNTQFPRKRLKSSINDMEWTMGYVDLNTGTKKGTGNQVLGVATSEDPDKIRGKRASLIGLEEFGKFPKVASVIKIAEPSVRDGDMIFGTVVAIGTGGEEGSDFSGALDLIYHPSGSHFLSFDNVWDKTTQGKSQSIFCFPAYVNRVGCMNKDGVSDVTKALYNLCYERWIAKYENPDPMQIIRTKAENPITLQDAIMKRDGSYFPVNQIMQRLEEIDSDPNFFEGMYVGKFVQKGEGSVEFVPTGDTPIRHFPTQNNKIAGAVEISALPEKNKDGKVYSGRYVASLDPVDADGANTMSLVSFFILDLWTDSIVCEWTGRLELSDDCYEVIRLGCMYYNAKMLYENDKKGPYAYFKRMNCLYLLAETPEFLKDKDFIKEEKIGNSKYGVKATRPINDYARHLLKNWMLQPVTLQKEDDNEPEVTVPKVMTMWNRAALEEARQWNSDGNYDRISSLGMLMLIREDRFVTFNGDFSGQKKEVKSKADDDYFTRNYKGLNRAKGWY